MSEDQGAQTSRSYGCTFGCGNPYDYIVVSVADSTTELLCLPCYVRLATDMLVAVTDPSNADVKAALAAVGGLELSQVPGPTGKRRGHNAPATTDDDAIFAAFEDAITAEELPDDFR
jgi:hypothetical protein